MPPSARSLLRSGATAKELAATIEKRLHTKFPLDSDSIRTLVLTKKQLQSIVEDRPKGFGDQPAKYHSDVLFLMGLKSADVLPLFSPREGVDTIWPGKGVIYSQRLSAQRTKSRLNRIMATPAYQSMTIRNWNTTTKLLAMFTE